MCTPVVFPLRFLVVNFPFAVLDEWQCSLSSNTVQRYKKNRQNAIVVPNHVHPCPESRASLSRIPCILLSSLSSWRCTANCIPTYRLLRRHVSPAASPRSFRGIGRTVTCYVGWLVDRRKGKNVNVNVNLKCKSMYRVVPSIPFIGYCE